MVPQPHQTSLVTLLFTDLVASTALKHQLGDQAAASLFQKYRRLLREILSRFSGSQEIETAGDSFLIEFTKPSDAVRFALLGQASLRQLKNESGVGLQQRIGIHLGEVVIESHTVGPKVKDLYGIPVDICARVMGLAHGGQILLTRAVFDNARQVMRGEESNDLSKLEWLSHGPYLLKGLEEPIEICEVGEVGQSPLTTPPTTEKAQRYLSVDSEPVLGWRPALGQIVPNTKWVLEQKLGEGGFGEVWLGQHQTMKERRVFKFCFRADRVRSLKREMTLFRVLKERVGDHPNIVRLLEVYFDEPPFYVVMDYVEGRDLKSWCEECGGVGSVPLEVRLEIVAQVADALQAAHDAGVIHRDVKPANILISDGRFAISGFPEANPKSQIANRKSDLSQPSTLNSQPTAKLTDFGIGQVVSEEALKGMTKAGFTQTILAESSSLQTGSQMYMAPELLAGKPASTRSDIYSLGVVLYQLLVGDLTRPLTTDWADHISDPILRDDLKHCFAGNPQDRFAGAGQLAQNLRALPERRAALEQQQAELAARERAAYRRGMVRTASLAAVIVALVTGLAMVALHQSRKAKATALRESHERERAEKEKAEARRFLYVANMNLAQQAWEQNNVGRLRQLLEETQAYPERGFEWYYWQRQAHLGLEAKALAGQLGPVYAVAFSPDSQRIVTGSLDPTAKVWETASGKELFPLKGHSGPISSVAVYPDGRRMVTGSDDQTAKVWEAASGKYLFSLEGHRGLITSVAVSSDGQRIATGSLDQTAKVWEAGNGKHLFTLNRQWVEWRPYVADQDVVAGWS